MRVFFITFRFCNIFMYNPTAIGYKETKLLLYYIIIIYTKSLRLKNVHIDRFKTHFV